MGRQEDRKKERFIKKKIGQKGLEELKAQLNETAIVNEVNRQCRFFEKIWLESTAEALDRNGITGTKAQIIARDIENLVIRRCQENGK